MKCLTLKKPVTITGLSPIAFGQSPVAKEVFARQQVIEMRPLSLEEIKRTKSKNGTGWYWQTRNGTLVPIDMSMVHPAKEMRALGSPALKQHFLHYLYFERGNERLKCVEHILALKTLGLDGVIIKALNGSTWVPYDGRAKNVWEAIEPSLQYDSKLEPMTMQLHHTYEDIDPRFGWPRNVILNSNDGRDKLVVKVKIDYSMFGGEEIVERHVPVNDLSDMVDILYPRGLMRPWVEKRLQRFEAWGWPHAEHLLKSSEFVKETPDPFKSEIARHRTLDFLGSMSLLAEAGTHVAGIIDSDKGNHKTDLCFLQGVKPIARGMYPTLECLAPFEPSPTAPGRSSLWRAEVRSVSHHRQEL
jgi:hypothetical protein